jgi:hypothetical protein
LQPSVTKTDSRSTAQPARRSGENLPKVRFNFTQQEYFGRAAARNPLAHQPRRKNSCVVQDQTVAGTQILRQGNERFIRQCLVLTIHHEHSRGVTFRQRMLRN